MTKEPERSPPTPAPAMALPTMKALLVGAVAQIKELNIQFRLCRPKGQGSLPKLEYSYGGQECVFDLRKGQLGPVPLSESPTLKMVYIRPKLGCNAALVIK